MKTMKKIVAILAVALLLCSVLPLSVMAADTEIVFNLGANGSATHADGTSKTTYSETVSGYTLNITNGTQFYTGARDAKGNSCLKLGSSKNAGSFKFTVPDDVTSVIIEIAKYKTNATKMNINGTTYTLTKNSNDGAYDLITVDTTSTKTVSVAVSSGPRAMINTITFVIAAAAGDCEHDWVTEQTKAPDCINAGENTLTCSKCGESKTETVNALGHDWEIISEEEATCTADGSTTYECAACGEDKVETIPALPHTYVDGKCSACGAELPLEATITFGDDKAQRTEYSTEIQVWKNKGLTFTNNKANSTNDIGDFTDPAGRFYKSSQIIIEFPEMGTLIIDAKAVGGTKYAWTDTLNAANLTYTETDGIYTITFAEAVNSLELTCANQVRANSITAIVAHECVYDNACDADCNKCGATREVGEHTYANAFDADCNVCGAVRDVVAPATHNGFSVSEDVSGLAVKFTVPVLGMGINGTTAIYEGATLNSYKLISMGAIATNGASTVDIPVKFLCDDDVSESVQFAIRIKNIPTDKLDVPITFTPYVVVEIDGVETTIYGEAQTSSYNQVANV